MIIAHYAHRLPADYDIDSIRERARGRAPIWDNVPGLYFKAFLLRERGHFGASQSEYSSLYLWRRDEGFHDFLADGRTKFVTESFGRPQIETRFTLDAVRGEGSEARFLTKQEQDIAADTDLTSAFADEVARNREAVKQTGVVVAAVGVDTERWKFTRVLLSEQEPDGREQGTVYQVLYLAQPLLAELPKVESRQVELA